MSKKFTGLLPTPRAQEPGRTNRGYGASLNDFVKGTRPDKFEKPAPPVSNQLTLLPGDSLASLTVLPGSEEAQQMTATSGLNISELLERQDQDTSLLRTFLESSPPISTRCYLTWKVKATPARRSIYQLAVSMPRIDEREFLLLPTPQARDGKGPRGAAAQERKGNPLDTLPNLVKMWPTPQAGANNPAAHNAMSGDFKTRFAERAGIKVTGQLNPKFVEWLMGFPLGWPDLED